MNNLLRTMRSLYGDASGNTLAIAAAAFFPLLVLIGSAIDLSVAYLAKSQMQNACDSAVLAGRQSMVGTRFTGKDRVEAKKFFDFNFPDGTLDTKGLIFEIDQNSGNLSELVGKASAAVPTSIMKIFGFETISIAVTCNAKREPLFNDIMLVLDVTGSMRNTAPGSSGRSKIAALREGALGIYRGIGDSPNTWTRYGIVPYSGTVNVAGSLEDDDILRDQEFFEDLCPNGRTRNCHTTKVVNIVNSSWGDGVDEANSMKTYRESGNGCIEERPSIGLAGQPVQFDETITLDDVNHRPAGPADSDLQFGRYDPAAHSYKSTYVIGNLRYYTIAGYDVAVACPAEARKLKEYSSESDFASAINATTARAVGYTYHDIGMLWGLRFISRDGFFSSENPAVQGSTPVQKHIVFMTDGIMETPERNYSAYGINSLQGRVIGNRAVRSELESFHTARFQSACNLAKSMGITVWVIALDVKRTSDIKPCATSANHFFISDGSNLELIFEEIGKNINKLRLSK